MEGREQCMEGNGERGRADLDLGVEGAFFFVEFVVVVGVHFKVMEGEFCFDLLLTKGPGREGYPLFEGLAFGEGEGVGFGNDRDDIDYIGQFLQNHNVNGFKTDVRIRLEAGSTHGQRVG